NNEVQTLTLGGLNGTFTPAFDGVPVSAAITFTAGSVPTALTLQTSLNTIPALSGNVTVTGANGGPFQITFNGILAGTNVSTLTATTSTGTSAQFGTLIQGGNPFPTLNGNVRVLGANGGPFTIVFDNAALAALGAPAVVGQTLPTF